MPRVFITGSSDGLGLMAAQLLVGQGHSVVIACSKPTTGG
jgi:NAD(P)-dependent dehydrogenase (short-subunit alcohol dehydrogenase family)